jgi:DNA-binding NarL/FixJ family response regulator
MPRIGWTPEEERRLLDLLAAGKSWTLISVMLKRSMASVKLQAKRLVPARDRPGGPKKRGK